MSKRKCLLFCYTLSMSKRVDVIGGGLAGAEACYFLLKKGYEVHLYEKRPKFNTPAHHTSYFGELVCSNSLKSKSLDNACGLLKEEISIMGSIMMEASKISSVPSGNALSVDRDAFAKYITDRIKSFPNLVVHEEDVEDFLEGITIVATGPLTSEKLSQKISDTIGSESLFFFDASAPIVKKESININIAYRKSRYDQGDDSYINCPFSKDEYDAFYNELIHAKKALLHEFDKHYFEGCMPIEVLASRGYDTMRYGPLKPKGLQMMDRPKAFAVVQLRQDNIANDLYNIVGFQTNLTYGEQKRVFRMIPGLENAEFVRYGLMHRNTYISGPIALNDDLSLKNNKDVYIAGQLSGVEGYVESAAMGLLAGIFVDRRLSNKAQIMPPMSSIIGSLRNYITHADPKGFAPMNANFGILYGVNKHNKEECIEKALNDIKSYWREVND